MAVIKGTSLGAPRKGPVGDTLQQDRHDHGCDGCDGKPEQN